MSLCTGCRPYGLDGLLELPGRFLRLSILSLCPQLLVACSVLRFHSLGLLPSLRHYSAFSMMCFSFALPVALSVALMRSVGESLFIFPSVQFSYVTGLYAPPEAPITSPKKPTSYEAHQSQLKKK
jgi:hypothetical protein